jgi:hypothetical protein
VRTAYHDKLDELSTLLGDMCGLAGEAMAKATQALLQADLVLAEQVITGHDQLARMKAGVEESAFVLLALQSPVAGDLRAVVSTMQNVANAERMGGLALHVAKIARRRHPSHALPEEVNGTTQWLSQRSSRSAKTEVTPLAPTSTRIRTVQAERGQTSVSGQSDLAQTVQSAHTEATQVDADVASDLIASGATTQSVDTVVAVLSSHREGASINAAAKASGINYRTAQRIVEAADRRQGQLAAAS